MIYGNFFPISTFNDLHVNEEIVVAYVGKKFWGL